MCRRDTQEETINTHSYQTPGKNCLNDSGILLEPTHDPEQQRLKIHGTLNRTANNKIRPKLKAGVAPFDKG